MGKKPDIPLSWHERVPDCAQSIVTRRRHTYVTGAKELEEQGYLPVTQVTMASGRLLRVGDPYVQIMVEGSVKVDEENRIRNDPRFKEKNLEIRFAEGSVIPLIDPEQIVHGRHLRGSRRGFTVFVKEADPPFLIADLLRLSREEPLGTVAIRRPVTSQHAFVFN